VLQVVPGSLCTGFARPLRAPTPYVPGWQGCSGVTRRGMRWTISYLLRALRAFTRSSAKVLCKHEVTGSVPVGSMGIRVRWRGAFVDETGTLDGKLRAPVKAVRKLGQWRRSKTRPLEGLGGCWGGFSRSEP